MLCESDKGHHHGYQRYYYPIFKEYEHSKVRLLEIGVADGSSMNVWNKYFTRAEHIYGIGYTNFQTEYKQEVDEKNTIYKGDQSDRIFLKQFVKDSGGRFDIIIDDGSHVPSHIKTSFEELWESVKSNGYYIIEDIETSYWGKTSSIYGYSLMNETSIVEYFKDKIDSINNEFRKRDSSTIAMISFVQNMIIIKKVGEQDEPFMNRKYRFNHLL